MEDQAIVDLYWERSENAIECTAVKYGRYCTSIALHILHNEGDAQEVVNDTYLGAWNAMPDQRPSRLSAFLGKITRNLALTRWDHNHAQKRGGNLADIFLELEDGLASGETVEERHDSEEMVAAINRFLEEQDPVNRAAFVRRYWYADSIKEVAERFRMSESKTKSLLMRMRGKLREYLAGEGMEL